MKSRMLMRLLAISLICTLLPYGAVWGVNQPPLSRVPVPEPPNLAQFVKDKDAAIRLGKALFWDMQAGSDGVQACASCHFRAGADNRLTNQLNPGPDGAFQVGTGPNYTLQPFPDFPFFQLNPNDAQLADLTTTDPLTGVPIATIQRSINDIVGSQGISFTDFLTINAGSALDNGTPITDPVFGASRRVTGRNAPSVINAVFNFTNFWDGRANNIFNGENPFGPLDQGAGAWFDDGVTLVKQKVAIPNASLASQATGPPLNDVEMSFKGRTFPELGRKMMSLPRPLDKQLVHPSDGVFSVPVQLSRATLNADGTVTGNRGLNTSYTAMIQAAFQDTLTGNKTVSLPTKAFPAGEPFTQIEANFSLFWGLAIQLYEATLVSDRAPFDRFQQGNQNALNLAAQRGFSTFDDKCAVCHSGSEFTNAVVGSQVANANPLVFINNTTHSLIRGGQTNVFGQVSDAGFFNIGVRPTADDPGRGGTAAGLPLSFSRLAKLQALGQLPFAAPQLPPLTPADTADGVQGAFKTPGLRNVELTAPYFHNGSVFTLDDVVRFYARGGNFNNPEMAAAMAAAISGGLFNKSGEVVEFLKTLTDERVRNERAPFDHPELLIPSGDLADTMITLSPTGGPLDPVPLQTLLLNPVTTPTTLTSQLIGGTVDTTATVAVSVNGSAPLAATVGGTVGGVAGGVPQLSNAWSINLTGLPLGDNAITITATSPTGDTKTVTAAINVLPSAVISGTPQIVTKQTGATMTVGGTGVVTYQFKVDGGAFSNDIPVATPIVLAGLADGTHTVSVLGKDAAGNQQPTTNATTATWTVKANPPVLTLNPVASPARGPGLTLNGTVELGLVPTVRADTAVTVGPVTVVGGSGIATWSTLVSGLKNGVTNFTITATDVALNTTTRTAAITIIVPDGNFDGTGAADISDALKALRMAIGLVTPTSEDLLRGDVAPLVNGIPAPDDRIDVSDALVILRKVVGLVNF